MTQGSIWKQLVLFSMPILLAHLLQQTYNAFDAIIVGRFVSNEALAAVGSSGPITMMVIAFFMGMSSGSSVLIAQFFGAKNTGELHNTVHTAILLAIIIGVALSFAGILFTPALLRLVQTPPEVLAEAVIYLRIYFGGLTGITVYNMGAAILTATGDSKRPLYFLLFASVVKIVLNLVFVIGLHMGVASVAWSTVIAQALCAVMVVALLCRQDSDIRLDLRKLRIHKHILKKILKIGLPGGIQGAIISFSNVVAQSYINRLGGAAMAGYGIGTRIDAFIIMPMQSMAIAVSTFVGQNLGGGKVKRAREGARAAIITAIGCVVIFGAIVLTFASNLLRIFTPDEQIIAYGLEFMRVFVPLYFLLCLNQVISGALRGAGDVKIPTIIGISCLVIMRQLYLFIATQISLTVTVVAFAFPVGWFLAAVFLTIYYIRRDWSGFEKK